jgi:hypothetical protein
MAQLGSELSAKIDAAVDPSSLMDEGIYLARLHDKVKVFDGKTVMWVWPLTIEAEANGAPQANAGRKTDHKTWISDAAFYRLKATFDAFGVPTSTDTDELIGKKVRIKLIVKDIHTGEIDDETGLVKLTNDVKEVLPAEGSTGVNEAAKERRLKRMAAAKAEVEENVTGDSTDPLF